MYDRVLWTLHVTQSTVVLLAYLDVGLRGGELPCQGVMHIGIKVYSNNSAPINLYRMWCWVNADKCACRVGLMSTYRLHSGSQQSICFLGRATKTSYLSAQALHHR